jgi:hypothetical protein
VVGARNPLAIRTGNALLLGISIGSAMRGTVSASQTITAKIPTIIVYVSTNGHRYVTLIVTVNSRTRCVWTGGVGAHPTIAGVRLSASVWAMSVGRVKNVLNHGIS